MSDWCKTCGEYMIWPDSHRCPPAWEIKHEEWLGDELKTVHAHDAQAAGEKYARVTDSYGDYTIVGGSEEEVKIRKAATPTEEPGPWETYILSGEPVPEYRARKKTE